MGIPITGLFEPSGGAGSFNLYDPADIQAGNVDVVLQAIAGGKFAGGSHATAPVGEVVAQVKTTTGAPTHSATEGTLCWNSVDDALYANNNGTTGWTAVGTAGFTSEDAQDAVGSILTDTAEVNFTYNDGANTITADLINDSVVVGRLHATTTNVFFGRDTASSGAGEEISASAARTILNVADGATAYTDEQAQDAVATMLDSTEFTYVDGTPSVRMANKVVGILRRITQPATTMAVEGNRAGGSTPAENHPVWKFDPTTDEYLDFHYTLSPLYNGGGLTIRLGWSATTATSGNVIWRAAVKAIPDDTEDMDVAHTYDYNSVTAATASASGEVVYDEITFTDGADMDSLAAGEDFVLRVSRNASSASDTMTTSDAELCSIVIRET